MGLSWRKAVFRRWRGRISEQLNGEGMEQAGGTEKEARWSGKERGVRGRQTAELGQWDAWRQFGGTLQAKSGLVLICGFLGMDLK